MRPAAGAVAQTPLSKSQALDSLTAVLARLDQTRGFHGSVLVADGGRIVHQSAHGLAHEGYQIPNRPDTKFNLASVGKTFTAVAIGQLVSQGKLKFTDTLARVLPDYPNKAIASKVTIAQLLSHRSGLGLYWDELFKGNWTAVRTTKDLTPFFVNSPLDFEPGARWSYSNTGFAVLALVIEKVSGEDYFSYIKRHIFEPAGMTDTDFYELDRDVPNLAVGYYTDEQGVFRNNLFTHTVRGGGAGGGWSTAPDLLKWAEALRGGKILDPAIAKQMMSRATDTDLGGTTGYGFGFILLTVNGHPLVGHTGGFPGIVTRFFFDPERDLVGVVMSNHPTAAEGQVWRSVAAYLGSSS
ncbi:MAG: serine hydrolase domain-containing protein [Gemmatimonadota bacterium]